MSDLPGYTQLPSAGTVVTRVGTVEAVRITGPFLVRGRCSVDYIHDGWLCKGEDGYLFGVEDALFTGRLIIAPAVAKMGVPAQVGVAWDVEIGILGEGSGLAYTSLTLSAGTPLPSGLSYSSSTHHITGTPAAATQQAYYLEFNAVYDNGTAATLRYIFAIYPA